MLVLPILLLPAPYTARGATSSPQRPTAALAAIGQALTDTKTQPDFDRDVLIPLRAAQAEQARIDAEIARKAAEEAERQRIAYENELAATRARVAATGTYGNNYAPGNCTWYVASRISVPASMGNATNWSYGLAMAGWRSGSPRAGSVGVSHVGWAGHVVVVEAVQGDTVVISEMNYQGLYEIDTRVAPISEFEYYYL